MLSNVYFQRSALNIAQSAVQQWHIVVSAQISKNVLSDCGKQAGQLMISVKLCKSLGQVFIVGTASSRSSEMLNDHLLLYAAPPASLLVLYLLLAKTSLHKSPTSFWMNI